VWKEDIVSWLDVGIGSDESGFVESDAEMRITTLFNGGGRVGACEARMDVHKSNHNHISESWALHVVRSPLGFDHAVPGFALCGQIGASRPQYYYNSIQYCTGVLDHSHPEFPERLSGE
jgi:hypothetical protein